MTHVNDCCIPIGNHRLLDSRRISGQLTDVDGTPLQGVSVRVGDRSTWTDDRGRFETELIPAGEYRMEISAPGHEPKTVPLSVSSCNLPCDGRLVLRLSQPCP